MSSLLQKRIWLQQLNILFIFEGRKHQAGHGQNNEQKIQVRKPNQLSFLENPKNNTGLSFVSLT